MPQTVQVEGVGTVAFPDGMTPEEVNSAIATDIVPRQEKSTALRTELEKVRGQDRFARWFGEDLPILPPQAIVATSPALARFLQIQAPLGTAGKVLRVGQAAAATTTEGLAGMTAPSMLPVAPVALVPGGAEAMSIYFGGEALEAGVRQISGATTPEEVGQGLGQVAMGVPMVGAGLRGRPLARFQRPVPPVLEVPVKPAAPAAQPEVSPDASRIPPSAEIYGEVRPQPVEGPEQVPTAKGGPRVQPPEETRGEVPVTPTAAEWESLTKPDVRRDLKDEGVSLENVEALLSGKKTPEQVVSDQLGVKKSGGGMEASTMIVEEHPDGSRSIGFAPPAGPASTAPVNVGSMSHEDAIRLAHEQGVERIRAIIGRQEIQPSPPAEVEAKVPVTPPLAPTFLGRTKAEWTLDEVQRMATGEARAGLIQQANIALPGKPNLSAKTSAETLQKRIFAIIDAKEKATKPLPPAKGEVPAEPAPAAPDFMAGLAERRPESKVGGIIWDIQNGRTAGITHQKTIRDVGDVRAAVKLNGQWFAIDESARLEQAGIKRSESFNRITSAQAGHKTVGEWSDWWSSLPKLGLEHFKNYVREGNKWVYRPGAKPPPVAQGEALPEAAPAAPAVSSAETGAVTAAPVAPAKPTVSPPTTERQAVAAETGVSPAKEPSTVPEIDARLAEIGDALKDLRKGYVTGETKRQMEVPLKSEQTRLQVRRQQLLATAPTAAPAAPAKPAVTPPAAKVGRRGVERPWDIIDEIEATVGKIRNKSASKAGEEGYYGEGYKRAVEGAARRLFASRGSGLDEVADTLRRSKFVREDFTVDDLHDALQAANNARRAHYRGETPEARQTKFADALVKEMAKKSKQVVSVADLSVGDKFRLGGEEFEVTFIDPNTGEVTVKDGRKFGAQTVPDGADLPVEQGSLKQKPQSTEFVAGQLFPEKEMPFNLAGERVTEAPAKPTVPEPGLTQTEMFQVQKIVQEKDPQLSANAAIRLYGDPVKAASTLERQLRVIDADPQTRKAFVKEQRQRLKEVVALLRQMPSGPEATPEAGTVPGPSPIPPRVRPGAASPFEFEQRADAAARQRLATRRPSGPNATATADAPFKPGEFVERKLKDYHLGNDINSPQWAFYFGRLGESAKKAWEILALTEARIRESIGRDVQNFVSGTLRSLPRRYARKGGEAFFDVLDGATPEQIEAKYRSLPGGDQIIKAADQVKGRLEEIRTTIRDVKRDAYRSYLTALDRPFLKDLFEKNIDSAIDTAKYTKADFADALTLNAFPDDWGIADGSYIHHLFQGTWRVAVSFPGKEGESFVLRARTVHEARARFYKLAKENPDLYKNAHVSIAPDQAIPSDVIRLGDRNFWRLVGEMHKKSEVSAAEIRESLQGIIGRKATRQKHPGFLERRQGFTNYSRDYQKVMTNYLVAFHRWLNLSKMVREAQPLIDQVRKEGRRHAADRLEELVDREWGKPARSTDLFDSAIQQVPILRDWVKPLALDRMSRFVRSAVALGALFTVRFGGLVNRLQPLQGLYPLVGERIFLAAKRLQHTAAGRLLLDEAGIRFDPGQYTTEGGFRGRLTNLRERLSGERSNQELAYLALYKHGLEQGMGDAQARNYAKLRGQLMTQFTPLIADTPRFLEGPITGGLFQFKRFPIKQLELLAQMTKERRFGGLARFIAVMSILGGLQYWARQSFVTPAGPRRRLKDDLQDELGEDVANGVMFGLPGLLGADISGSLVLGEEPMGANIYEKVGRQLAGPGVSIALNVGQTLLAAKRQPLTPAQQATDVLRRIPALKPLGELIALQTGDIDVRTPAGEARYRKTLRDTLLGLGSFRTTQEARISLAVDTMIELQKETEDLQNRLYVEMATPGGHPETVLNEIQKYNERWPEMALLEDDIVEQLNRRFRAAGTTTIERQAGRRYAPLLQKP